MSEKVTINGLLNKLASDICDNYCKWPERYEEDEGKLYEEHCDNCPLNIIG